MPKAKLLRPQNAEQSINLTQRRFWFNEDQSATQTDATTQQTSKTETQPDKSGADKGVSQDKVNQLVGDARKAGRESALAEFLKELGVEKLDEAKELVKAKKQADEAAKSDLQKMQEALAAAEKRAEDSEKARQELEKVQRVGKRDSAIKAALVKANATDAESILILMSARKADLVNAVMKDDGSIDDKALTALVAAAKVDYKREFRGTGPGTPSVSEGQNVQPGTEKEKRAYATLQRIIKG